jgi:redox-sensing transcriptional repressor
LNTTKIPKATVFRLTLYYRYLQTLCRAGCHTVSSAELAKGTRVNSAQLRKDLSYFGKFGVRGVGYEVKKLLRRIQEILGLSKSWNMALIGLDHIGYAMLQHRQFEKRGYNLVAAFDITGRYAGERIHSLTVHSIDEFDTVMQNNPIDLGVIAIDSEHTQQAADAFVRAGVKGILNFSSTLIHVPKEIQVKDADFTILLDNIIYAITRDTNKLEVPSEIHSDAPLPIQGIALSV